MRSLWEGHGCGGPDLGCRVLYSGCWGVFEMLALVDDEAARICGLALASSKVEVCVGPGGQAGVTVGPRGNHMGTVFRLQFQREPRVVGQRGKGVVFCVTFRGTTRATNYLHFWQFLFPSFSHSQDLSYCAVLQ